MDLYVILNAQQELGLMLQKKSVLLVMQIVILAMDLHQNIAYHANKELSYKELNA